MFEYGQQVIVAMPKDTSSVEYKLWERDGCDRYFCDGSILTVTSYVEKGMDIQGELFDVITVLECKHELLADWVKPRRKPGEQYCPLCGWPGEYMFSLILCKNKKCQNGQGYKR